MGNEIKIEAKERLASSDLFCQLPIPKDCYEQFATWLRKREQQSADVGARGMAKAYGEAAYNLEFLNEFIKQNAIGEPTPSEKT